MSIIPYIDRPGRPLDPAIALLGDEPEGLALDFASNRAWVRDRATGANNFLGAATDLVSLGRLSAGGYFDRERIWQAAGNNAMRLDHDPATGEALGLRLESASTNLIRNPRGEGSAPGSPGTPPTNWVVEVGSGLSREVVGAGTEDGIPYLDVRFHGTTTGATALVVRSEAQNYITAAVGDTFTASAYVRLLAGSLTGFSPTMHIWEALSNGSPVANGGTAIAITGAPLRTQRYSHTRTMTNESTERMFQQVRLLVGTGVTFDLTVRVGLPQVEKQAFMTSPVLPPPGSPQQATRAAETLSKLLSEMPFNPAAGTLIVDETQFGGVPTGTYVNHYNELYRDGSNFIRQRTINSNVDNAQASATSQVWVSGYAGFPGGMPRRRIATSYGPAGSAFVRNGVLLNDYAGAYSIPPALEVLRLMQNGTSRTVRWLVYIPRALSAAEMQARTAL